MFRWVPLLLVAAACQSPPEHPLPEPPTPMTKEDLYLSDEVHQIRLQISEDNLQLLRDEPRQYVVANVQIGDEFIENIGVRLKGAFSFRDLRGKAALKLKFNFVDVEQRFLGMKKMTLNNMVQDRSASHEWLAYRVFQSAGVHAPHAGFAWVSINGNDYGLYANVETLDDRFLDDRFGAEGNLYEAPWGADLSEEDSELYEQDEGDDLSRADLAELVTWMNQSPDDIFFAENTLIDTEEFLRFMAAEAIAGHWDGYWKANNYFLFHNLQNNLWTFHPWGLDRTFDIEVRPFTSAGILAQKCRASARCLREYARIGREVAQAVSEADFLPRYQELSASLEDHVDADPRMPHPIEKIQRHQAIARGWLSRMPDLMLESFSCADDQGELDEDEDGYGACLQDCDDSDPNSHPGAEEVCDGKDNDCDGRVDELDCQCAEIEISERTLHFCTGKVPWASARDLCAARGLELVTPNSSQESVEIAEAAHSLLPDQSWYIGANDREEEREWRSAGGDEIGTYFAPGEPDNFDGENCAVLASFSDGQWADERCSFLFPYICAEQ